jgi:hypothetical protein
MITQTLNDLGLRIGAGIFSGACSVLGSYLATKHIIKKFERLEKKVKRRKK